MKKTESSVVIDFASTSVLIDKWFNRDYNRRTQLML